MSLIDKIDNYLINDIYDNDFFMVYPFTNENINGYLPYFDLMNKSLLTVGSSGDQAINAIVSGCDDITVCDICPLTKSYYYLKMAALLCLSRDDFLSFLCKTKYDNHSNPHLLTLNTFRKIRSTLKSIDYDSYYIWEYLYKNYNRYYIDELFRCDIADLDNIIGFNKYLNSDSNYLQARKMLQNVLVNFICDDIAIFNINRKFDNIWFSNVAQYLDRDKVIAMGNNGIRMLNDNGSILLCYYRNGYTTFLGHPGEGISYINSDMVVIPSVIKSDTNSSILIHKKSYKKE